MEKLSAIITKDETIASFEKPFEGTENSQNLFEKLIQALKDHVQRFYVNAIEPCIHLCAKSTFAAVKTMEDKIRVEFDLPFEVQSQRFIITTQMPADRFQYCVDINNESDINEELMIWLKKVYDMKERTPLSISSRSNEGIRGASGNFAQK